MTTPWGQAQRQADRQHDPDLGTIMSERRQALNLAYRPFGSLADAEDVVQETYARWYAMSRAQREAVHSSGAWLTTVASRICLNMLGPACSRRETYVGEWISEPGPDPAEWITFGESVTMAFLVAFESLPPAERVAFVLHDIVRYPFALTQWPPAAQRQEGGAPAETGCRSRRWRCASAEAPDSAVAGRPITRRTA